jgi:hypothetical protein
MKEIAEIQQQLHEEQEVTFGFGWLGILKEMFLMPNNFYFICLGLFSQLLSQWSGSQSITIYAPESSLLLSAPSSLSISPVVNALSETVLIVKRSRCVTSLPSSLPSRPSPQEKPTPAPINQRHQLRS